MDEHNHITRGEIGGIFHANDVLRQPLDHGIEHGDLAINADEVGNYTSAGDTAPDDADGARSVAGGLARHFGGTVTSRQPPSCGGTPPLPRMRKMPAIVPANERATRKRRNVFMQRAYPELMELRIVRRTTHFDAACRFYGELLGWRVTHEWPADNGQGRGRLFGYGDTARIELIEHAHEDELSGVFVSVEHDDVVSVHDRLVAGGVQILRPITDMPWGHRSFAVHDPTGLELVHFQQL